MLHRATRIIAPDATRQSHYCARRLAARCLCTQPSALSSHDSVIYRFAWVRSLRIMLRLKILQLSGGLGIMAPVVAAAGGNPMGAADTAALAGLGVGTLAVAGSLSWYCERLAMQISWAEARLRISTLTIWGHRRDRDYALDDISPTLRAHDRSARRRQGLTPCVNLACFPSQPHTK